MNVQVGSRTSSCGSPGTVTERGAGFQQGSLAASTGTVNHCAAFARAARRTGRHKTAASRFVGVLCMTLVLLAAGCGTMKVTPLATNQASSYTQHEEKNGLVIGIQPMTDRREIQDMFKVNLLEHGLLPILLVVQNQSASDSFIVPKEQITVLGGATGSTNTSHEADIASGAKAAGEATGFAAGAIILASPVVAAPLIIASLKLGSDATVVQYNLADKEFYTRTLGPGEKAQGFLYFRFPKTSPPSGAYHIIISARNPASGKTTAFDFPVNLTVSNL